MPIWKRWKRRIASKTLLTCTIASSTKMSLRMIQASSLTKMILSSKFQSREGSHVACKSLGSPFSQKIKWMSLVKSQTRRLLASLKVVSRLSTKKNKGRTIKKSKRRWVKSLTWLKEFIWLCSRLNLNSRASKTLRVKKGSRGLACLWTRWTSTMTACSSSSRMPHMMK